MQIREFDKPSSEADNARTSVKGCQDSAYQHKCDQKYLSAIFVQGN